MERGVLFAAEFSLLFIADFPAQQLADLRLRQHVPKLDVKFSFPTEHGVLFFRQPELNPENVLNCGMLPVKRMLSK